MTRSVADFDFALPPDARARRIEAGDVEAFAAALGFAAGSRTAAHWFALSLLLRSVVDELLTRQPSQGSPGIEEIVWHRPVRAGDELRLRPAVLERRDSRTRPDLHLVRVRFEGIDAQEVPVLSLTQWMMLRAGGATTARAAPYPPRYAPPPGRAPLRRAVPDWDAWVRGPLGGYVETGSYRFEAADLVAFAQAFDPQPFHLSEQGAQGTVFGRLCASGLQSSAVAAVLADEGPWRAGPTALAALRWRRPIAAGEAVTFRCALVSIGADDARPGCRVVTRRHEGCDADGDVLLEFEDRVRGWPATGPTPRVERFGRIRYTVDAPRSPRPGRPLARRVPPRTARNRCRESSSGERPMNAAPSLHDRDASAVLHPHSNLKTQAERKPLIMTGGSGVYIVDEAGNRYLESAAGLGHCSLGFNNERLARAAYEQMTKLGSYHVFRNLSNTPTIELSERLQTIAPMPVAKVLIQSSGSEANDTAVKIVWYYWNAVGKPEKRKIIYREGSYHGATIVTTALCGGPAFGEGFGLRFPEFLKTEPTNYYRHSKPGETEEQFAQRLADALEALILREGPETVGAFIGDPTQANSGGVVPPAGYWQKVQAVLKKYDVLLIADEVVTAFGRTGNTWGCQTFGIQPDFVTTAKALSSGMVPVSALLIGERVYSVMKEQSDKLGAFWHGYTYSGHPVGAAVALETLKIYEDDDILGHIRRLAPFFRQQVETLADHPLIGNVSCLGLIGGLDLTNDKASRGTFSKEMAINVRLNTAAMKNGMFMRVLGNLRIHFSPPFIIQEHEVVEMVRLARKTLDEVHAALPR